MDYLRAFARDLSYALRGLRKSPGFTAVAVLTLALGIGANSAIFSVVNGVLLRPLPYAAPDRIMYLYTQFPTFGFDEFWVSPPEYRGMQRRLESFQAIGGWRTGAVNVAGDDDAARVPSSIATAEFFQVLGVPPLMGRTYTVEEDVANDPVVVISHNLWRTAFGADPGIIGRTVDVDSRSREVIGVMPPGFDIQDARVDVWVPTGIPESPTNFGSHFLNVVGRLAPEATVARAAAEVETEITRWQDNPHFGVGTHEFRATSLTEETVGSVRTALMLLLGAVGFVLLIACANVANLLLARAEGRQREVAVRVALGAGRGRLVAQFMTESLVLGLAGGALGLFVSWGALRGLLAAAPDSLPRLAEITLDGSVVGFTFALAIATGLLFGLAPLLHLRERAVGFALKEGGLRSTATRNRLRLRRMLVIAEVGLAVVLVVGSGLMLRSFAALQEVDAGFDPDGLLTFQVFLAAGRYPDGNATGPFIRDLTERLATIPGVSGVVAMSGLPPLRQVNANDIDFEDYTPATGDPPENIDYYQFVHGDYFDVMGIDIVAGRPFHAGDADTVALVAIVNERAVETFFRDLDPIGRRVNIFGVTRPLTIVGVARDVKQGGLSEEVGTEIYFYNPQVASLGFAIRAMNVAVRVERGDPLALAGEVRRIVAGLDPALPVASLQTMEQNMAGAITRPRFLTMLLGIFAAVALALAAIGTYGVMAYSVAERSHEFGIRMAMGAPGRGVLAMVLRSGMATAGIGVALGIAGAFVATRLMESMLFGVGTRDLPTFLAAPVVLLAVAAAASLIPARRATRLDPANVLREE